MENKFKHIHFNQNYSSEATKWLKEKIEDAINKQGFAIVGLSGGSTPGPIYEELGKASLDWSKVYVFLVDDRYIAREHQDSNKNLLDRTLLKNAKIPVSNLILPDESLPLEKCISDYGNKINELFKKGNPDVVTLGLGPDGHIASLFPVPTVAKEGFSKEHSVIHTTTTRFAVKDRITLTLPYITPAKNTVFFLTGEEKLAIWREMVKSPYNPERWPAHDVINTGSTTLLSA